METGEVIYEKVYASPRPPPKISLKHDWMKEMGSEVARQPEGQVVQQFKSSQSNQPTPNPDQDRTGQPAVRTDRTGQPVVGTNTTTAQDGRKTSRSQEIDTRSFHEEAVKNDRTEQPVVNRDESSHEQTMLNEVNMDFCEDREPPRSTCSSTRSTTKQSLQPVQCEVKADDSGRGQRRAV